MSRLRKIFDSDFVMAAIIIAAAILALYLAITSRPDFSWEQLSPTPFKSEQDMI